MSEPMNFGIKALLPKHTESKTSSDPIGNDIVKITEEFTKMLIAQVSNQDPDNPMDSTQMITQYSQMLSTMGSIKMSNSVNHFEQVKIAQGMIGKTVTWMPEIDYSKVTYKRDPVTGELLREDPNDPSSDLIVTGGLPIDPKTGKVSWNPIPITDVVTGADFSGDNPMVYMNGQFGGIPVSQLTSIYSGPGDATQGITSAANVVGKTVTYFDPENPNQELTGIVTEIDFTTSMPTLAITGQAAPIPFAAISKIHN